MLLAMLCVVSSYAQSFEVDGLSYQVTKSPDGESPGEVEVTGGEIKEEIEFPETVTYNSATYMVTSIGSNAFSGRSNSGNFTKKYIIPGTVRSIGNSAFYDNYYLEEVEFNEGLQTIGVDAFGYNFALKEIRIPSTVTAIEDRAFRTNQQNQATISCLAATPPANLGSETFQGRTDATLHVVAADVEAYQETEYWKDFSVISGDILNINRCSSPVITCDNNILTISCKTEGAAIYYTTDGSVPDENALRYTSPISYTTNQIIRAIAIAEGYESSGVKNFYDKEQVENVTDAQGIKYTLKQADDGSFYYSVTGHSDELNAEIVIPTDLGGCPVKIIEEKVFEGCTDLSSITISNSVTTIGARAFYGCSNLSTVILGSQLMTIGEYVFGLCTSLSSITIPNSVTTIGKFAFDSCSSLTSITIGNNVTALRGGTFYYCTSLTDINVPNSVTIIESEEEIRWRWLENIGNPGIYGVFEGCSSLSSVTIPNSVTSIGDDAFRGCSGITMVTSEISTPFAVDAFGESNANNATLVVPQGSRTAYQSADGWNGFAFIYEEGETIYAKKQTDEQGLYYTLKQADDGSFYYSVTGHSDEMNAEIVIPADIGGCPVRNIEGGGFRDCSNLTSITIPNSVTSIGERAFWGCNGLTSITLPSSVTCEGYDPFNGTSLNNVKIVILDYSEFCNNTAIKVFGYSVPIHLLDNEGNEITEYVIPEGVTSICDRAFFFCSNLSSITIPEGVTTIGREAFRGCSSLSSIMIPSSVTTMGWAAFSDCSDLQMVTSEISTPFAVDVFGGSNASNATLIVPKDSRNGYKSTDGWGFAFIYEEGETLYDREQNDEQGVKYTLMQADDGSVYYSVTGHSDEMDTEIIIPTDLDGCPVKTIEELAFSSCTDLTSVTIPNSITSIGRDAFYGCGLVSVTIPNSVTTIGDDAFYECRDLTSVKIGNGIASIGYRLFSDCENLTSVKMGKNVSSIGKYAFNGCSSLASITLPDVLESIGAHAFQYTPLTSVNIPESVKTIGDEAFRGCGSLASVGFEEGLTSIGDGAFRECALTSVTIPNSVTSIGEWTFSYNRSLTTAILGDDIEEIKSYTFFECSALSSVIIPDGVTSIGSSAFSGCHLLTSIKLPESLTSLGGSALPGAMKSIELPNAFTVISEGLFYSNNFQYIKLGNKVKSIGKNAFGSSEMVIEIGTSTPPTIASDAFPNVEYLSDLNVIVPNAAAETVYRKKAVWEEMTFSNKENISEVTVNTPGDLSIELIMECGMMPAKVVDLKVNGTINADDFTQMLVNMKSLLRLDLSDCDITEIPDDAMSGKTQLQELTLPTGLQIIGKRAFQNCPYLTGELDLPTTLTSIGESSFVGTNYTSVKLSNSLKTIGDYAFNNLPIQQRLVLPNRLTSVGAHAFDGTKITGLVIPDGVKSIGDGAFAETPIEGHVTIPDGITYLGEGAFRNTRISSVFLPNSVTTLCTGLFQGCSNLNLVYVPDNFTDMSNYAFDGCGALTTLRLSANTATMGEYSLQSTPLEYVKVPSQVEVLSKGVLKNCTKLESLSLPANLKTVEAEALYGCTALRNMSVEAITPPTIKNRSAIRGINTDKCLISIPTSAYRNYVLAEYWGQFVQMRNDIAVEITGNGEIAFESVTEEEEEEDVYEAKVRAVVEEEEEKVVVYEAPLRADVRRVAASVIGDEPELMSMIEVDTDETPLSSDVRRVAAPAIRRAPQLATEEEPMTYANNGSSIYAPPNAKVLLHITPAEGKELLSATLDGEDIMPSIVNGIYTATADKKNAKLVVNFSGQSIAVLNGDANGDGTIDVTDIVAIANYILGRASSSFDEAAADVNGDGSVDVTDIVAVANIILRGTGQINAKMHGDEEMLDPQ